MLLPKLTTSLSTSPTLTVVGVLAGLILVALSAPSHAEEAAARSPSIIPAQTLETGPAYKEINLSELVKKAQADNIPGQRIIFAPTPIKFRATLAALPVPQKADYLLGALGMMKISNPPKVSQRIGLDYGSDKPLSAYIEEGIASRLSKEVKPGQARTFYAYHVYNYSRGPALLVTAFSD